MNALKPNPRLQAYHSNISDVEVTPKGLIINRVIGAMSSTSQNPHINQIITMQLFED